MARASRKNIQKDGKPRGLLAHEDYYKGVGRRGTSNRSELVTPKKSRDLQSGSNFNSQRNSASQMNRKEKDDTFESLDVSGYRT